MSSKKFLPVLCSLLLLLVVVGIGLTATRGAKGASAHINAQGNDAKTPVALVQQIVRDSEDVKQCVQENYHGSAAELAAAVDAEQTDLNRDGKPEYLVAVQGACGGAANGPVFVYAQKGNGYTQLLNDIGQDFTVKKTATGGYFDLQIGAHSSAVERELTVYKFMRGKYRPSECITQTYVGKRRGRDILKFKRHSCSQDR